MQYQVYIINSQNKSVENFVGLLQQNNIQLLIDVRTDFEVKINHIFQIQNLTHQLNQVKIGYKYIEVLSLHSFTPEREISTNYSYLQNLYYVECALDFNCKVALWIEDINKTIIKDLQRRGIEIIELQLHKLAKERT